MKGAKITLPNGKMFALVPRSGSYSIIWQALPENLRNPVGNRWHPINATGDSIGSPLSEDDINSNLCCLVRNPIDRFRSACARQNVAVEQGLLLRHIDVHFWSLDDMGLISNHITYFKFPDDINLCAQWLGLNTPVPQMNEENDKPNLDSNQIDMIIKEYSKDIVLWNQLNGL